MDSYNPHDPFWFDEDEHVDLKKTEQWENNRGVLRANAGTPELKDGADTAPESAPTPNIPPIPDSIDSGNTPDHRQEMADSEKRAFNFMKKQAENLRASKGAGKRRLPDTLPRDSELPGKNVPPPQPERTKGIIPSIRKPPGPGPDAEPDAAKLKDGGIKGRTKPPSI